MTPLSPDPLPSEEKKHSLQSIFVQCVAIPLFGLIIYTLTKQLAVSLGVVVLFYGNVLCLWLSLKFMKWGDKFFDAVLIVNVSLILLGLVLVSLSMGGFLEGWLQSEHWNNFLIGMCVLYFVAQSAFVAQATKLNWIRSSLVTVMALMLNTALCYAIFSLFFNK